MIRKIIVNSGDNDNINDMLIAKPKLSASIHSTDSYEDGKIYCNIEYSNRTDFPSILKNVDSVSSYCKDAGWLVAPPDPIIDPNAVDPFN